MLMQNSRARPPKTAMPNTASSLSSPGYGMRIQARQNAASGAASQTRSFIQPKPMAQTILSSLKRGSVTDREPVVRDLGDGYGTRFGNAQEKRGRRFLVGLR